MESPKISSKSEIRIPSKYKLNFNKWKEKALEIGEFKKISQKIKDSINKDEIERSEILKNLREPEATPKKKRDKKKILEKIEKKLKLNKEKLEINREDLKKKREENIENKKKTKKKFETWYRAKNFEKVANLLIKNYNLLKNPDIIKEDKESILKKIDELLTSKSYLDGIRIIHKSPIQTSISPKVSSSRLSSLSQKSFQKNLLKIEELKDQVEEAEKESHSKILYPTTSTKTEKKKTKDKVLKLDGEMNPELFLKNLSNCIESHTPNNDLSYQKFLELNLTFVRPDGFRTHRFMDGKDKYLIFSISPEAIGLNREIYPLETKIDVHLTILNNDNKEEMGSHLSIRFKDKIYRLYRNPRSKFNTLTSKNLPEDMTQQNRKNLLALMRFVDQCLDKEQLRKERQIAFEGKDGGFMKRTKKNKKKDNKINNYKFNIKI